MFQYTPYLLPFILSAIILFGLMVSAWQHRTHTAAIPFGFMMLGAFIWVVAAILEIAATELQLRLFIADLSFIGIAPLASIWLVLVAVYTGRSRHMKWLIRLSFIVPIISNILIWSNDFHHFWRGVPALDTTTAPFPITIYNYNFWFFWVQAPTGYITFIVSFILLLRSLLFASIAYRRQIVAMLVALVLPLLSDTLYVFGISPIPNFNLTPVVFSLSGIIIGWSLFRYKFLDLMPVARDAIIRSMDDIVVVLDEEHRIVDANLALQKIISRDVSEMIGLHISEAFPKQYQEFEQHLQKGDSRLEIVTGEDSQLRYFNVQISPLYQGKHRIGDLIVTRDVTEGKLLEEKQLQLEIEKQRIQTLKQFMSDASHDFMTPLAVMKSSLYVAQKTDDEDKRLDKLNIIEGQVDILKQMLQDTLFMTKLDMTNLDSLSLEEVNFNHLLEQQIENYRQEAGQKNQQLILDVCSEPIVLSVQQDFIVKAISELLDNAIKYTDDSGIIRVAMLEKNQELEISISDTGCGIALSDLPHIFERLYRIQSHRPMDSSSGLGLAIVQRIVELHHGRIEVESTIDEGSTFRISLPMRKIKIEEHASV